jgi:hypothetical protein
MTINLRKPKHIMEQRGRKHFMDYDTNDGFSSQCMEISCYCGEILKKFVFLTEVDGLPKFWLPGKGGAFRFAPALVVYTKVDSILRELKESIWIRTAF